MKEFGHIVITGFMASGKTVVGRALASQLDIPMTDLDDAIYQRAQRSIAEIIKVHGEDYFRVLETSVLNEILGNKQPGVVALGGGAWIQNRNRELITVRGCITVWLDTPFELCWQRIKKAGLAKRPLAGNYNQALKLYLDRQPVYAQAMLRIIADPGKVASELAGEIFERCNDSPSHGVLNK